MDTRKECCRLPENMSPAVTVGINKDLKMAECKVCGRRHFELIVDPGVIGVRGASL